MSDTIRIAIIIGTRPEAIKLAPVVLRFNKSPRFEPIVILTGQHKAMVHEVLALFGIVPHYDLALMQPGQTLTDITTKCLTALEPLIEKLKPSLVVVQGDTTSALAGALAAFYQKIPVCHVEAGLRTPSITAPFPEEANRRMISQLAAISCAPTNQAMAHLRAANIQGELHCTGNTVIDALHMIMKLPAPHLPFIKPQYKTLFTTIHRTESRGNHLAEICRAFITILNSFPDTQLVLPMHPNPQVREPLIELLGSHDRVRLIEPLDYRSTVELLAKCHIVLTDSGGLQEEAPTFGKPVIVLRETTERQELIEAGGGILVGTDHDAIVKATSALLTDDTVYSQMSSIKNPFGDGRASEKIVAIVENFFAS